MEISSDSGRILVWVIDFPKLYHLHSCKSCLINSTRTKNLVGTFDLAKLWIVDGHLQVPAQPNHVIPSWILVVLRSMVSREFWRASSPLKFKVFSWLAFSNNILITDNLAKRNCLMQNCVICNQAADVAWSFLLLDCCFAKQVLISFLLRSSIHGLPDDIP